MGSEFALYPGDRRVPAYSWECISPEESIETVSFHAIHSDSPSGVGHPIGNRRHPENEEINPSVLLSAAVSIPTNY